MLSLSHIIGQYSSGPSFEVVLRDQNNEPVDLTLATSVTFRMHLVGDNTTFISGLCSVLDEEGGIVAYPFLPSDTEIPGTYIATISAVLPSGAQTFPYNDYYLIQVEPDLIDDVNDPVFDLVFATVANARSMGYELTAKELVRAQGHIESVCGRMIEAIQSSDLSTEDAAILKKATVYQAVWVAANGDVEERTDVTQIRTAGLSGESAMLTTDGIVLAPLARRLLTRLSWVRSRSIRTSKGNGVSGVSTTSLTGGVIGWKNLR